MRTGGVRLAIVVACFAGSVETRAQQVSRCEHPLPAGAQVLPADPQFNPWKPPWVFSGPDLARSALSSIRKPGAALEFHLDGGQRGTVRVEPANAADERLAAVVKAANGAEVARVGFVAPYSSFQLVPIDLAAGDGDELILITEAGHASPRVGADLTVWLLAEGRAISIAEPGLRVGGRALSDTQFGCNMWRTDMVVDLSAPKPRTVQLRGTIWYEPPCCLSGNADVQTLLTVLRGQLLRYVNGKYTVR